MSSDRNPPPPSELVTQLINLSNAFVLGHTGTQEELKSVFVAIFKKFPDLLNKLVGSSGKTLLHMSVQQDERVVRFLLEQGAHPDIPMRGEDKQTPLMDAVRYNNIDVVRILLEYGADPEFQNKDGRSAMDIAQESGNQEIIALLASPLHLEKNKNKGRSQNQLNRNHRNNLEKMSRMRGGVNNMENPFQEGNSANEPQITTANNNSRTRNVPSTTVNGGKRRKSRHRKHRRRTTIRRSKTHRRRRY